MIEGRFPIIKKQPEVLNMRKIMIRSEGVHTSPDLRPDFRARLLISGFLLSLFFVSCTDFFTNSWGKWAARDPANLIRNVTADNVDEYISMAGNNPDLSLEVLRGIANAMGGASEMDKIRLQNAAVTAAINASDLTNALMNNVSNISDLENSDDVKDLVRNTLNGLGNLVAASDTLTTILVQDPALFKASASADDLALAAVLILAGEAKKADDLDIFSNHTNGGAPPGTSLAFADDLAAAAKTKYEDPVTGNTGSLLYDLLSKLKLV
jgi:hypothetical protein